MPIGLKSLTYPTIVVILIAALTAAEVKQLYQLGGVKIRQ